MQVITPNRLIASCEKDVLALLNWVEVVHQLQTFISIILTHAHICFWPDRGRETNCWLKLVLGGDLWSLFPFLSPLFLHPHPPFGRLRHISCSTAATRVNIDTCWWPSNTWTWDKVEGKVVWNHSQAVNFLWNFFRSHLDWDIERHAEISPLRCLYSLIHSLTYRVFESR